MQKNAKKKLDIFLYDIVAPGIDIFSVKLNGGYTNFSMTSIACPIVAGVCALILSASSTINNKIGSDRVNAVRNCLYFTAEKSYLIVSVISFSPFSPIDWR